MPKPMNPTVRIAADQHIPVPSELTPEGVVLDRFDPASGLPPGLQGYDALLIRTVNPINNSTLPADTGRLSFIGSATAGHDHVDRDLLVERKIRFAWSAGCNARSVAEYVATALLYWSLDTGASLDTRSIGVVGVGHAGEATAGLLEKLGLHVVRHDPPRAGREPSFESASMDDVLACDILTFHTSLVRKGRWPSLHWFRRNRIGKRRYELVINAARGGVIDESLLLPVEGTGPVVNWVIDTWEGEPQFDDRIARQAFLATPHIAGYSLQAKHRATEKVMHELCREFGLHLPGGGQASGDSASDIPDLSSFRRPRDLSLEQVLDRLHPMRTYDRKFRDIIGIPEKVKARRFSALRTGHPLRPEFSVIRCPNRLKRSFPVLESLGLLSE